MFCALSIAAGFVISQECLALMYLCIKLGFSSSAAWLTAATGVSEAIIIAGINGYLALARSDHSEGGITFEAAKARNFTEPESENSPPI